MWTFVNTGCPGVVRGSMTCTISGWKALTMDRFEFLDWPDFLESLLSKMLKCVHSSDYGSTDGRVRRPTGPNRSEIFGPGPTGFDPWIPGSNDSDLMRPQVTYLDLFFFERENLNFIFIICDTRIFKKNRFYFKGNRMWRLNLYRWNRRWRLSIIKIVLC